MFSGIETAAPPVLWECSSQREQILHWEALPFHGVGLEKAHVLLGMRDAVLSVGTRLLSVR